MDRQTLRDWVHRYNADGVEGLKSRQPPGRVPALTEQQMAELRELVVKGPDPADHDVVRWRCADIQAEVARRFSVDVHVHTIGKWLNRFGLTRLQPRPYHPKKDVEAEASFKKRMARPVGKRFLQSDLISLRQRIRSQGIAPAKMEIRAFWSS
jgi:transposase